MKPGRRLRVLISAGPTREPIDRVRFLSNASTGAMGARLAAEALARGHRVSVVSGPVTETLPRAARVIRVEQAAQMEQALRRLSPWADVVIMAAAVCDFRLAHPLPGKLPRRGRLRLSLEATPDLIRGLPRHRGQVVVGFSLEVSRVAERARQKLREKRLDLLLAQRLAGSRTAAARRRRWSSDVSPFGRTSVEAWLVSRDGGVRPLGRRSKPRLARVLLDKIESLWYGQHEREDGHMPQRARGA